MPRIFGSASTGGGGTPGGSTTQVQFNNAGAFGGVTGATTNGTFLTLVTPVLGVATGTSLALGDGTLASPALNFVSNPDTGMYLTGTALAFAFDAATVGYYNASSQRWVFPNTNGLELTGASGVLRFGMSPDCGLSRISAGVIGVGNGTAGSVAGGLQAATLALGGATIGSNALAVTGTISAPSLAVQHVFGTSSSALVLNLVDYEFVARSASVGAAHFGVYGTYMNSTLALSWSSSSTNAKSGIDTYLTRGGAAATLQHGAADAASPVAQTIKFQDVVAGTSNTAGVNATIQAPAGTGTGAGGSLIFQVAPAGSSGTAKNAQATALTIDSTKKVTLAGDLQLSNAYVATPQVPTGYITIYDSTGTAYKVSVNV